MDTMHASEHFELRLAASSEPFTFHLGPQGLRLRDERWIPLHTITEVNLNRNAGSEYDQAHYMCRIFHHGDGLNIRADVENATEAAEYRRFQIALHAIIQSLGGPTKFTSGMRSKFSYRTLVIVFGLTFVGIEALVAFAISQKGKLAIGILFMFVVAVMGYGVLWLVHKSLRPLTYDPARIPGPLLP
jgi:hypothetical protein